MHQNPCSRRRADWVRTSAVNPARAFPCGPQTYCDDTLKVEEHGEQEHVRVLVRQVEQQGHVTVVGVHGWSAFARPDTSPEIPMATILEEYIESISGLPFDVKRQMELIRTLDEARFRECAGRDSSADAPRRMWPR